jgi:hypothetical protein
VLGQPFSTVNPAQVAPYADAFSGIVVKRDLGAVGAHPGPLHLRAAAAVARGTTGRWWTPTYRAAWSRFQHRLAASFDGDPLIRSVAVSSSATLTAEPFVQSPQLALHTELFADGWSSQTQQQCLAGAFSDYSGWKHTPIDYAFNPFVT